MHQLTLFTNHGIVYSISNRVSKPMRYTIKDLRNDFPDDDACLKWLVGYLYPKGITCATCEKVTNHYKLKGRKVYSCSGCGHQVSPTAGTIFHKSRTPLTDWFHAIYLMSSNKAGTSAKQVERELGVTYKTAWRMMHQIRKMMDAPEGLLAGEVEVDETYVSANVWKRSSARRHYKRNGRAGQVVFGMVDRKTGVAKAWHVQSAGARVLKPLIREHIKEGTLIHTDGYAAYKKLPQMGYEHRSTDHGAWQFYTEESYTQNVENLWSTMKPRWKGTYKRLSPKYLQAYVNEYTWRYSNRHRANMFWALMCRVSK
jgi:transposase